MIANHIGGIGCEDHIVPDSGQRAANLVLVRIAEQPECSVDKEKRWRKRQSNLSFSPLLFMGRTVFRIFKVEAAASGIRFLTVFPKASGEVPSAPGFKTPPGLSPWVSWFRPQGGPVHRGRKRFLRLTGLSPRGFSGLTGPLVPRVVVGALSGASTVLPMAAKTKQPGFASVGRFIGRPFYVQVKGQLRPTWSPSAGAPHWKCTPFVACGDVSPGGGDFSDAIL